MKGSRNQIQILEIGELAYAWLSGLGIKVDKQFITNEIATHPDYPALTSLVDILEIGGLYPVVRRADISDLEDFQFPCLAGRTFPHGQTSFFKLNSEKEFHEFKSDWNGIIVYADPADTWSHPRNSALLKTRKRNLWTFLAFGLVLVSLALSLNLWTTHSYSNIIWPLTSALGILIGISLMSFELGMVSEIVQKVCGMGGNAKGCSKVLNSPHAKGVAGISMAEWTLAYFCSQLIIIFTASLNEFVSQHVGTISGLAILGFPIAASSLYIQKIILKQWCALCLGVVTILIIQAGLSTADFGNIDPVGILLFLSVILIIILILHPIKSLFEKLRMLYLIEQELSKWKKDTYLFLEQWKMQTEINNDPFESEIELANPNGALQFTIACNPFCRPCAIAHKQLEKIIGSYKDQISVKVRFAIDAKNVEHENTKAVNFLLNAVNKYQNPGLIVHEWFERMDLEVFKKRWPADDDPSTLYLLYLHSQWSKEVNVEFTPTVYLNGRSLPKRYTLDEIFPMIPELYHQIVEVPS